MGVQRLGVHIAHIAHIASPETVGVQRLGAASMPGRWRGREAMPGKWREHKVESLSLEGVSQMVYILPERLLALVRPAFDLVLQRI